MSKHNASMFMQMSLTCGGVQQICFLSLQKGQNVQQHVSPLSAFLPNTCSNFLHLKAEVLLLLVGLCVLHPFLHDFDLKWELAQKNDS